jgi:hypothetical protein
VEELADIGAIEARPKMEGPNLIAIFAPKAAGAASTKTQAASTKTQAPSTKTQAASTKAQKVHETKNT